MKVRSGNNRGAYAGTYRSSTPLDLGQSPLVWLLVLVEQRLDLLLLLALTDLVGVSHLEELGGDLHEPLRLDSSDVVTVLSSRED